MKTIALIAVASAAAILSGCATPHQSPISAPYSPPRFGGVYDYPVPFPIQEREPEAVYAEPDRPSFGSALAASPLFNYGLQTLARPTHQSFAPPTPMMPELQQYQVQQTYPGTTGYLGSFYTVNPMFH